MLYISRNQWVLSVEKSISEIKLKNHTKPIAHWNLTQATIARKFGKSIVPAT